MFFVDVRDGYSPRTPSKEAEREEVAPRTTESDGGQDWPVIWTRPEPIPAGDRMPEYCELGALACWVVLIAGVCLVAWGMCY